MDGEHEKAVEEFKSVLVYDPDAFRVHIRLAGEYLRLGLTSKSLKHAERAVEIDSKSIEGRLVLGGLYTSMKMLESAKLQYHKVLEFDPKHLEAPLYLGALHAEQGDFESAKKSFLLLQKNAGSGEKAYLSHYYLGRLYLEQGKSLDRAASYLKKSLKLKPDFEDAVLTLGHIYQKKKNEKEMLRIFRAFQQNQQPSLKVGEYLIQTEIKNKNYEGAIEQLNLLDRAGVGDLNIKVRKALLEIELKRYAKAKTNLEEIVQIIPENDKMWFYLGAVNEELKEFDDAAEAFGNVPHLSPLYKEAVIRSAFIWKNKDDSGQSIELLKGALEKRNDVEEFYTILGSFYDEAKEYQSSLAVLKKGTEKFKESTTVWFYYGSAADRVGKSDITIKSMEKVLELNPEHAQALNYLAYTYAEKGERLDQALELAKRAIKIEPTDGYIMDTLGWIYYKKGQFQEALRLLEAAHSIQPKEAIIAEHLGDAYRKNALLNKAIDLYKLALTLEKNEEKLQSLRQKISRVQEESGQAGRTPASQ